jgi:chromosome segregation ATPase
MKICILQDIAALEDDRETHEEKRDAFERELRAAEATKTMAAEEEREAAAALKRAEEKSFSMVEQVEPLTRDLIQCEEGIRKSRRDQEHYVAKKAEFMNNAKEKTALLDVKNGELARAIDKAKEKASQDFFIDSYSLCLDQLTDQSFIG